MFNPGHQWVEIEIKHEGFGVSNKRKFGASSGNCCYLIKYAQQVIISKQVKHNAIKDYTETDHT